MKINHDHPGDALTIGCPACIAAVQRDQEAARVAAELETAPLREVTVKYHAVVQVSGDICITTKIPDHWDADDIERHLERGDIGCEIDRRLDSDVFGRHANDVDFDEVEYSVGRVLVPAPVSPRIDQPDLFGGAA